MTVFAGVLSREPGRPPPDSVKEDLRQNLVRRPGPRIAIHDGPDCFLAVDRSDPAARAQLLKGPRGAVTALVGDPLPEVVGESLSQDTAKLHEAVREGRVSETLRSCRGVFALASAGMDPPGRLVLANDRFGVRLLYYSVTDDWVFFSTALRVLEAVHEVPKTFNLRAVNEIAVLGYPLSDRTPYVETKVLLGGEWLEIVGSRIQHHEYWRWSAVSPDLYDVEEGLAASYSTFSEGIRRRRRDDEAVLSFLSGGLDSRCVVSVLRSHDTEVHTVNAAFSSDHQDTVFARDFGEVAGTRHTEFPMEWAPDWQLRLHLRIAEHRSHWAEEIDRPKLIWSGDGGSVGVGQVFISNPVVEAATGGNRAMARAYIEAERLHIHKGIFQKEWRGHLSRQLQDAIESELDGIDAQDPVRRFHLFLMQNDQRRHLAAHYEDIDLHQNDLVLPFFDGDLFGVLCRLPPRALLRHEFYDRWLDLFPPVTTSVPWQTYPGHVPCPLPIPSELRYQWSGRVRKSSRIEALRRFRSALLDGPFPAVFFDRKRLAMAAMVHVAGLRDYQYLYRTIDAFKRHWSVTEGRWEVE